LLICGTFVINCSHPGKGSGRSPTGAGGLPVGVGADGGGAAGASSGGIDGGGGTTSTPPPMTTYDTIDDLEDGDGRIIDAHGHQGPWHTFNSANGGDQTPPFGGTFAPEAGGAQGSMFAVHTVGDGYTYAGVGFDLNNATNQEESPQSQSFDASAWDGIVFWAKGTAQLRIEFSMKSFVPRDRGGTCDSNCWDVYGNATAAAQLTADWKEYKVPFTGMQRESGSTSPAFDATQLMDISFKHTGQNDHFDFWIDDVQFYRDPPVTTGGGTGGAAGASGGACNLPPPRNGTGSYTVYWFGQGSFMDGDGYRTACGYFGHEATLGNGATDTVENIAVPGNFAAIPSASSNNFDSAMYCGACAEVSGNGKTAIVTIIDACPKDTNAPCANNPDGHLDLSVPAMNALGYGTGYPQGTTWRFVPCPVTGDVVVRIKPGNSNQVYIENEVLPIQTVEVNGAQATRLSYGAWQLPGGAAGQTLKLTDIAGHVITVQVTGSEGQNQSTGQQFPQCTP
jgi:expansin (peptidoglycan-binding protein)